MSAYFFWNLNSIAKFISDNGVFFNIVRVLSAGDLVEYIVKLIFLIIFYIWSVRQINQNYRLVKRINKAEFFAEIKKSYFVEFPVIISPFFVFSSCFADNPVCWLQKIDKGTIARIFEHTFFGVIFKNRRIEQINLKTWENLSETQPNINVEKVSLLKLLLFSKSG